jgi:type I restriction enzyme S subunit
MVEWKKVKVNSFLKERESRIKPIEANKMSLKRLNKIDFSGKMHLLEKPTNTDMILIRKGDLVISGINVEKGAVAVYQGKEDILATIHYSAYIFDETKIDIEYFKTFLKSKAFREVINTQIRSGIKTELKAKKFLPLEINLPDLKTQIAIRNKINLSSNEISELDSINDKNKNYISKLRQAILQEAVQGKLVKQNPKDEPTSELLRKIKAEKEKLIREGKIRKDKPLAPISEEEIPYSLPKGWEWVRLEAICEQITDIEHNMPKSVENGIKFISAKDILDNFKINLSNNVKRISEIDFNRLSSRIKPRVNDIIYTRIGTVGEVGIVDNNEKFLPSYSCCIIRPLIVNLRFLAYYLKSGMLLKTLKKNTRSIGVPDLGIMAIKNFVIGFPPISEQKRIVEKVDKLMAYCDELEEQVKANQINSERLMQAVLKESFQ